MNDLPANNPGIAIERIAEPRIANPSRVRKNARRPAELASDGSDADLAQTARNTGAPFAKSPPAPSALRSPHTIPRIAVRLDRSLTSGWIRNRQDTIMAGIVVADHAVETVSLTLEGEVRAVAVFGQAGGLEQSFSLTLARQKNAAPARVAFDIVARTRDGQEHREAFVVQRDERDSSTARVIEGPLRDLTLPERAAIPVLLYAETAIVSRSNLLRVAGWSVALTHIVTIRVYVDDQIVGSALLDRQREDIAAVFPNYPNSRLAGFSLAVALPDDVSPAEIAVEAISLAGSSSRVVVPVEREPRTPADLATGEAEPDPRRAIFLHCDEATLYRDGELVVAGWAVCATGVASVTVLLDDILLGEAELGLPRPDVGDVHFGIPQGRHSGFSLRRTLDPPASGEHRLAIEVRNGLDDLQRQVLTRTATESAPAASEPARAAPADPQDFHFQMDYPLVLDGVVPDAVAGRLVIEGWALARSGVEAIEVFMDERSLGPAYFGSPRRDVEAAFPDWQDALRSGYIFHCPKRDLEIGTHTVRVQMRSRNGTSHDTWFQIKVQKGDDTEDYATIRRSMTRVEANLYQDLHDRLGCRPVFRLVLVAAGDTASDKLEATLRSLVTQIYQDWEVVIITGRRKPVGLRAAIERSGAGSKVTILPADDALVTTSVKGTSCLFGVLFPGDEVGCDALAEVAVARGLRPGTQFIYADEDRVSPSSETREPFFKPDWSPDLLLSTNYIGRPWFATAELLAKAGITPRSLAVAGGDYDAALRCTELTSKIHHLPKLLSRRGAENTREAERQVLVSAAIRRSIRAEILPGCIPGTWRLKRTAPIKGKVSIIIPTCAARGYIATCLDTLRASTRHRNFEIICIDTIPPELPEWKHYIRKSADKVVEILGPFNWSRCSNRGADQAVGDFLLFLNDDIEVQQPDWLDALLEHAVRPEVGIVGPQLLYPNRKVQHAGIFLTTPGIGRHAFRFLEEDDAGYFGMALTQRNVAAVTGACMLIRRDTFDRIGRFDEAHEVVNNDTDFCLRAWRAGLTTVYTPYARLIHHELASRNNIQDIFDATRYARQWRTIYASGDPFFSPRLTKSVDAFTPDTEPARAVCAGRPLYGRDDIQRILAVKLDHIGDFITALPALRRLRMHFPAARIYLLASSAAKAFLAGEDCVDELIEFEFWHARSGLGQKGIAEDDLRALGERLAPHRFDLAIDLRKQVETRHVLKYIPARFRAGYDYCARFPWLDIVLQWEGDTPNQNKRSHVSDDLVRLVDTVAMAAESDRRVLPQATAGDIAPPPSVPPAARALFVKPVVAVHPGVGAIMRQWPAEYFASLIDLLVDKNKVNVVIVGGPDESELADQVLSMVANRINVVSLAGKTSLNNLTLVLRACSLYVGNNSGPQHIAAALGVPTVGIYSGVVDAAEWGATGPRAIAVQRKMVCCPCYLVKPEDCIRDMACLRKLEPAVVHQYCEMMLARVVPETPTFGTEQAMAPAKR
jgi:ADP-heptose:LPS heptosyltransferase/GT2 family glycosyltransferase